MTFLCHILWSDSSKLYNCISLYLAKRPNYLICKSFAGRTEIISEELHTVDYPKSVLESSRHSLLNAGFLMMAIWLCLVCLPECANKILHLVSLSVSTKTTAVLFSGCCVIEIFISTMKWTIHVVTSLLFRNTLFIHNLVFWMSSFFNCILPS